MRVIVDGTWGFASRGARARGGRRDGAGGRSRWRRRRGAERRAGSVGRSRVYSDVTWVSDYRIDPFEVSTADKIAVLGEYSGTSSLPTAWTTFRRW